MVFVFKAAPLAPELQVSMGPSPHLLFFCIHNSVIMTRISSLYGSQTSPVVVCMENNEINIRIASLYGSQHLICGFCIQNSDFRIWITSLYGS